MITLEASTKHAEIARSISLVPVLPIVQVRVGPAGDTLQVLSEGLGPFDLIFIDADKEGYPEYFT